MDRHLEQVVAGIPFGTKFDARAIDDIQSQIQKDKFEPKGFLQNKIDGSAPKQVFLDSVLMPEMPHFRLYNTSKWSGYKAGKGSDTKRYFVQKCCGVVNGDMIWDTILEVPFKAAIADVKYIFVRINRETAQVIDKQIFNERDKDSIQKMNGILKLTSSSDFIIFVRASFTGCLSIKTELFDQLNKMGMSANVANIDFGKTQTFAFIGVPYSQSQIDEDKENDLNGNGNANMKEICLKEQETMDFCFYLSKYFPKQEVSSKAYVEIKNKNHKPPIIMHIFEPRTDEEDWTWAMRGLYRTPNYLEICKAEYEELAPDSIPLKIIAFLVIFIFIGHVYTGVGRFAIKLTLWKYAQFSKATFGVWDDNLVALYNIHGQVRAQTLAFDNPYSRKLIADRVKDDREIGDEFIEDVDGEVVASKAEYDRQKNDVKTSSRVSYQELKRLEYNLEGPSSVADCRSEGVIMEDHSSALYALVVPRAALLQLFPKFCAFLTIFAAETAETPVFVQSEGLAKFLPSLYPRKEIWAEVQTTLQNEIQEQRDLKLYESYLDYKCIDVEKEQLNTATGLMEEVDPEELKKRHEINDKLRDEMRAIMASEPAKVPSYVVAVSGLEKFFGDNRLLVYIFSCIVFLIEVMVVVGDKKTHSVLIVISLFAIIPNAALTAFAQVAFFAWRTLGISDEDLYNEFGCLMPIVNFCRSAFQYIFLGDVDLGPTDSSNDSKEIEVEMTSFRSSMAVKHNFSNTADIDTDISIISSQSQEVDLEGGVAVPNPLHSSATTTTRSTSIDFEDFVQFGKADYVLNDRVWKQLSSIEEKEVNQRSQIGDTLILRACQHKCSNLIPLLIRNKADVNAVNADGASCLHFSCDPVHPSARMTRDLLEAGASPNVKLLKSKTKSGSTPLHYAAGGGNLELCRLLMNHDVDVSLKDACGKNAAYYATKAGHAHLAALLKEKEKEMQEKIATVDVEKPAGRVDVSATDTSAPTPTHTVSPLYTIQGKGQAIGSKRERVTAESAKIKELEKQLDLAKIKELENQLALLKAAQDKGEI